MLQAGDYAAVNHEAKNGFVGIETAEAIRQAGALEEFKARHPEVYARAVEASVAVKVARRDLELARGELVKFCPQGKVNDLLASLDTDTVAAMKALANRPKVAPAPPAILAGQAVDQANVGITATKLEPVKIGGQEMKGPGKKSKGADSPA
jgi:hypothetical protein